MICWAGRWWKAVMEGGAAGGNGARLSSAAGCWSRGARQPWAPAPRTLSHVWAMLPWEGSAKQNANEPQWSCWSKPSMVDYASSPLPFVFFFFLFLYIFFFPSIPQLHHNMKALNSEQINPQSCLNRIPAGGIVLLLQHSSNVIP